VYDWPLLNSERKFWVSIISVVSSVQALESYSTEKKTDSALPPRLPLKDYCGSLIDIHELHKAVYGTSSHPDFKVCRTRLFETSELCEIFFNKWVKYLIITKRWNGWFQINHISISHSALVRELAPYRRGWLIGACTYHLQQQENMRLLYVCAY